MKINSFTTLLLILSISLFSPLSAQQIKYAGSRQSCYGVKPFPDTTQWGYVMLNMASFFPGSQPTAVWIIGTIHKGRCHLEFPTDGNSYEYINFNTSTDKHESYLSYFDTHGIKVYLQVESGMANINDLINIILTRYQHHTCVAGFGIDVEWYQVDSTTPNESIRITDEDAGQWNNLIKSYKPEYRMFLKHWLTKMMPPTYRGDVIFISDSQGFDKLSILASEFGNWADYFKTSLVMFQIGYPSDYKWWKELEHPPKNISEAIAINVYNKSQELGIIWMDFSLYYEKIDSLLFTPITAIEDNKDLFNTINTNKLKIIHGQNNSVIWIKYNLAEKTDNANLYIISTNGRVINSYILNYNTGKIRYNIADKASGVYYINLRAGNSSFTKKALFKIK